jgi:hypothetical protein
MKKVMVLAIMSLVYLSSYAQTPLSFEKVITVDSVKKNEIYSGVKQWFAMNSNTKYTLEVDDRETGLIIANFTSEYSKKGFFYISYDGYISYSIRVQVRDGRYKITIDKFIHDTKDPRSVSKLGLIKTGEYTRGGINASFNKKVWIDLQQKAELIASDLFSTFNDLKFTTKNNDNW